MKEYVEAPRDFQTSPLAVEIGRYEDEQQGSMVLLDFKGYGVEACKLRKGKAYTFDTVFYPSDEFVDSKKLWKSNYLSHEEKEAALTVLHRRYQHVVLAKDDDALLDEGKRIRESDYWSDVRNAAQDLKYRIDSKEINGLDGLDQALHETIDSSGRVMYTHLAMECLLYSKNTDYALDEGLLDGSCFDDGIPWSSLAFYAFRQDVIEHLERIGVDFADDSLGREDDEKESHE